MGNTLEQSNPFVLSDEDMSVIIKRHLESDSQHNKNHANLISTSQMLREAVTIINILMPNLANDSLKISL